MRTTTLRRGIVGLVLLAASSGPAATAATLRWKFKPGETLHYVMDQKTFTSAAGGGKKFESKTTQTVDMDWVVKDVAADGVASLTLVITRIRTRIESLLGAFEFDSKAPEQPRGPVAAGLVPLLTSLVGAEFSFKMTPRGELSDVQVPDVVLRAVRQAGAAAGAGGLFSADGMKNMVAESSLTVPADEIAKGKAWSRQSKLPMPQIGALQLDKTYSYQGPETRDGQAMERIDLEIKTAIDRAPDAKLNVELKTEEGKGSFLFDNASGHVADSTVSEKLELVFKVAPADVTQVNETSTVMRLVKGEEAAPAKK